MTEASVPNVPIVPGDPPRAMPSIAVNSAVLGRYNLIRHPADEDPCGTLLGYVAFRNDPTRLVRALRLNRKDWTDDRNRRFEQPIVAWYSMEKPDGTPLF